ncbi:unnamed protein product [Symbiodinium natans]|uniref:Uncharacterized protein n=1 Tax=Symbiodinium natans TaxID=878477 RepID=A0A812NKU2_9DINO|nr:unnamed protein product [Symbiodinium natans]
MSAEQALQIVRGISQAAEIESAGTDNAEGLREAAGRVCASLMFFLEHPDSRVQVHCAGTMKKCFERYSDAISAEDMVKVRRAYTRCIQTAKENTLDGDRQVALRILGWIVSRADGEDYARAQNDEEEDLVTCPAKDRGGQVAVKAVGQKDDEELRAGLLAEVIKLPQVVSVTFEAFENHIPPLKTSRLERLSFSLLVVVLESLPWLLLHVHGLKIGCLVSAAVCWILPHVFVLLAGGVYDCRNQIGIGLQKCTVSGRSAALLKNERRAKS